MAIYFKSSSSPHAPLKRNPQQLLRLDRKFHRQLLQHFLGKAVDDQRDGFLCIQPALHGVEHLVVEILLVVASCSICALGLRTSI